MRGVGRAAWLAALCAFVFALAGGATEAAATGAPRIVYVHAVPGAAEIVVMDADGSQPHVIARGRRPRWSPDGRRIAFWRGDATYVIGADGTGERCVARGREPAWSPDGTRLVVSDRGRLTIVELASGTKRFLTYGSQPDWSAKDRIAFVRGTGVHTIAATGGRSSPAVEEQVWDSTDPRWTPDGERLLFTAQGIDESAVLAPDEYALGAFAGGVHGEDGAWAGDRSRLLLSGNGDICRVTIAGRRYERLTFRRDGVPNVEPDAEPGAPGPLAAPAPPDGRVAPACAGKVADYVTGAPLVERRSRRGAVAYTIELRNIGGSPATDVWLVEDLHGSARLLSVAVSQGSCSYVPAGPIADCYVGTVPAGGTVRLEIGFRPIRRVFGNGVGVYGTGWVPEEYPKVDGPIECGAGGTERDDVLEGTGRADVICGLAGSDTLRGAGDGDRLLGGFGDDVLDGGRGSDVLAGGAGDDRLLARDRTGDVLEGGAGYDRARIDDGLVDRVHGVERLLP